jgi:hypothetical protein
VSCRPARITAFGWASLRDALSNLSILPLFQKTVALTKVLCHPHSLRRALIETDALTR